VSYRFFLSKRRLSLVVLHNNYEIRLSYPEREKLTTATNNYWRKTHFPCDMYVYKGNVKEQYFYLSEQKAIHKQEKEHSYKNKKT
jgi:hypothetical protein